MKIKELINTNLLDENEQVCIMCTKDLSFHDTNDLIIFFKGYLHDIPDNITGLVIEQISAMSDKRKSDLSLNKYGWMEIWVDGGSK